MTTTIGIDLGTTNTVCCTIERGSFRFLNFSGKTLLPSVLMFRNGKLSIGEKARKKSILYADHCIISSKTHIADFSKKWLIEDKSFCATDVAVQILTHVYSQAVRQLKAEGNIEAVITVPAYFTANQINEIKKAGELAGFTVKQIIAEPVAAAVAYGFDDAHNQKLAVIDIGGGTFDVSILQVDNLEYTNLATEGDRYLGGDDFDKILFEMCLKKIRQTAGGVDLADEDEPGLSSEDFLRARQRLLMECELAKIELSEAEDVLIEISNLFEHRGKPYHFSLTVSRDDFEAECSVLLNKIQRIVKNCVSKTGDSPSDIDKVILVGGTSYMPVIRNFVADFFNKQPYADMDLSKLVAMGAALVADDEKNGIQIRDIITHSLGIRLKDDRFSKLLEKDKFYPISNSDIYSTVSDYQEAVEIKIYEGEDENDINNNTYYGCFSLENIESAPAGVPEIKVSFYFDKSRDLHVKAEDLRTGSNGSILVQMNKEQ